MQPIKYRNIIYFLDDYILDKKSTKKIHLYLDMCIFPLTFACATVWLLASLYCLNNPRNGGFLGQVIPLKYYSFYTVGLITVLYHSYLMLNYELAMCSAGLCATIYLFYLIMLIQEVQLNYKKGFKTRKCFRNPQNLRIFYRSLQILHENILCFMGPYISLLYALFTVFLIFVFITFILFWSHLDSILIAFMFICGLGTFVFWMLLLQVGKYLWITGNKVFDSWGKVGFDCSALEKKAMKKFRRSCKIILIRHGNVLVIGRMSQFVYIQTLIVYTCKIFLAAKKLLMFI